jgi:phosphoglycerate dehydrogenase-like enzyme
VHLPLTEKTAGMLDRAALARMKPDAVPVNTSRGGVVAEAALVDALCSGGLAAAGLDEFALEPIPADNPLLGLDNVVLTPHVTWYTVDRRSGRLSRKVVMVVRRKRRSRSWL